MPDGAASGGVVASDRFLRTRCRDRFSQRSGGVGVQRDHPFGVAFADWDPQPGVAVGVGVEAVEGQPADLIAAGAGPAGHQQRGTLHRVGQGGDGGHEQVELTAGQEPRH